MSKFPCGICEIGVKYQGIQCTNSCKKWYHSKCLSWSFKEFKSLTDNEINTWSCDMCNSKPNSMNVEEPITEPCQNTISDDVHNKVLNFNTEESDLETSLNLAAEVGNVLLAENNKLKHDLQEMILKNSKLAFRITKMENEYKLVNEEKIEKLQNENDALLVRNNLLVEAINRLEQELEIGKQLRINSENIFEELDREKEENIKKCENIIQQMQKEINYLKQKLRKEPENKKENSNVHMDKAVQTQTSDQPVSSHSPFLLHELTEIKLKQEKMETIINTLQQNIGREDSNVKLQDKQYNFNPPYLKETLRKRYNSQGNNKATTNKKNIYSVSLQKAKHKHKVQKHTNNIVTNGNGQIVTDIPNTSNKTEKIYYDFSVKPVKENILKIPNRKNPPITAIPRSPDVTIEDFYNKYIQFYRDLQKTTDSLQEATNLNTPFLEDRQSKKERDKTTITTK